MTGPQTPQGVSAKVVICNERGLHARASAKFVRCAEEFSSDVVVTRDGESVSGTSIMGLMMLAAAPGCALELRAEGVEAQAALDALADLVERKFDED